MADLIIRTESGSKIVREGSNTIVGNRIVRNPVRRRAGGGERKNTPQEEVKAQEEAKKEELVNKKLLATESSQLPNQFNIMAFAKRKQESERLTQLNNYNVDLTGRNNFPINNQPQTVKDFKHTPTRVYTPSLEDEYRDFTRQKAGISQETTKAFPEVFEKVYKESFDKPEETPYNKVEEIPKAEGYFDYINRYLPEVNKVKRKNSSYVERRFSQTVVAGTLGAVQGVANVFNPETYKPSNIKQLTTLSYYQNLAGEFIANPVGTSAQFYTGIKTYRGVGSAISKAKILTPIEKITYGLQKDNVFLSVDYIPLNKKGVSRTRGTSQKIPFKQKNIARAQSGKAFKDLQKSLQYPKGQYAVSGKVKVGKRIYRDFDYLQEPKTRTPPKATIELSTPLSYTEFRTTLDPYTTLGTKQSKPLSSVRLTGKELTRAEKKLQQEITGIKEGQRQTRIARELELLRTQKDVKSLIKPYEGVKIVKRFKPFSYPQEPPKTNLKVVTDNKGVSSQELVTVNPTVQKYKPLASIRPKVPATVSEPAQTSVYTNRYVARTQNPQYTQRSFNIPQIDNKAVLEVPKSIREATTPAIIQKPATTLNLDLGLSASSITGTTSAFKDLNKEIQAKDHIISSDVVTGSKSDTRSIQGVASVQDTIKDTAKDIITEQKTIPIIPLKRPRRRTPPKPKKIVNPVVVPKAKIYNPPKPKPPIIQKPVKKIVPPPSPFYYPKTERRSPVTGYNVLVRRKGVFRRETVKPLSKQEALSFGASRVGTSASATFKLEPVKVSSLGSYTGGFGNLKDFKVKKGKYIEKRSRRIKSLGELKEITFKGIASQRKSSKSSNKIKKLWGFK